jgi:hypothetical protein
MPFASIAVKKITAKHAENTQSDEEYNEKLKCT